MVHGVGGEPVGGRRRPGAVPRRGGCGGAATGPRCRGGAGGRRSGGERGGMNGRGGGGGLLPRAASGDAVPAHLSSSVTRHLFDCVRRRMYV